MSKNIFTELSDAMAAAAEKAGSYTVLVDARRRMPASGIAFAVEIFLLECRFKISFCALATARSKI